MCLNIIYSLKHIEHKQVCEFIYFIDNLLLIHVKGNEKKQAVLILVIGF